MVPLLSLPFKEHVLNHPEKFSLTISKELGIKINEDADNKVHVSADTDSTKGSDQENELKQVDNDKIDHVINYTLNFSNEEYK